MVEKRIRILIHHEFAAANREHMKNMKDRALTAKTAGETGSEFSAPPRPPRRTELSAISRQPSASMGASAAADLGMAPGAVGVTLCFS